MHIVFGLVFTAIFAFFAYKYGDQIETTHTLNDRRNMQTVTGVCMALAVLMPLHFILSNVITSALIVAILTVLSTLGALALFLVIYNMWVDDNPFISDLIKRDVRITEKMLITIAAILALAAAPLTLIMGCFVWLGLLAIAAVLYIFSE